MIRFNRANFDGKELTYLAQAVIDGHVSGGGQFTDRAEKMLSEMHGGARVLLTTSCTHALEMAALLLGLSPGDEVIVPSFTFTSTASAFLLFGGRPVFVDVDPITLNAATDLVEAAITDRTRAICVVHYAGVGADLEGFRRLADKYGLALVEDNAHGLGGRRDRTTLGTVGDLSTLSFHETKNITCGEGGALVINDPALVERAEILRDKGTNRSKFLRGQVDKYTWVDVGSSWSPSDLLAGVLVGQLERFEWIQRRRHEIWTRYHEGLAPWAESTGMRLPNVSASAGHTAHLFHLRYHDLAHRSRAIEILSEAGILAVFHYQPLHLSEVGRSINPVPAPLPVTEDAADTLLRLPMFVALSDDEVDYIIANVVRTF